MSGARSFRVTGRVQGVGYRAWLQGEAERLGLTGWVRNRRDGSVEALAAGEAAALDELQKRCSRGPRFARVDGVKTTPADADGLPEGFEQRPTV